MTEESDSGDVNSGISSAELAEEEAREARKAWCDEHEKECREAQGMAPEEEAAPEPNPSRHEPGFTAPEPEWDKQCLLDLVDLWESGESVSWPSGLDPLTARQLLERSKDKRS